MRYHAAMSTLTEIEDAMDKLPPTQQEKLLHFLTTRLQGRIVHGPMSPRFGRNVLDIAPVSVGEVLSPSPTDDDLLAEMLERRV